MIFEKAQPFSRQAALRGAKLFTLNEADDVRGEYFRLYRAEEPCAAPDRALQFNLIRTVPARFPLELSSAEYHSEPEVFCFVSGVSTLMTEDAAGGMILMEMPAGTAVWIPAGIRHYIGPALSQEAVCIVAAAARVHTFYQTI